MKNIISVLFIFDKILYNFKLTFCIEIIKIVYFSK